MIQPIKSAARKMLIDFEDTKHIKHQPTKGRAREQTIIENFLGQFLPSRYGVSSGVIIDAENTQSRSQDLIIYDQTNTPILHDLTADKLFFPESVLATIEVKSTLTARELEKAVINTASVWQLKRAPVTNIFLAPNLVLSSDNQFPLCMTFCFTSRLTLEAAATRWREYRANVVQGHALSCLVILEGKHKQTGLVLNVMDSDLSRIVNIPNSSTRLAVVNCETSGDTLLYAYLMLMEHLRVSGQTSAGPDLLYYARMSGLGDPKLGVSKDEMRGAYVSIDGKSASVDIMELVREISIRMFNGEVTDQEILDWFYYWPQIPGNEGMVDERAKFYVNRQPLQMASPHTIYRAVERYRNGDADETDSNLLNQFIMLIRAVKEQHLFLEMGFFNPKNQ
jgi:hypothetical protein